MNMPTESGYKGKIVFFKHIEFGYFGACAGSLPDTDDYILLGECDVDVTFENDTRAQEIEVLEAKIKKQKAEHQHFLDVMEGKIQSLRAIENIVEVE